MMLPASFSSGLRAALRSLCDEFRIYRSHRAALRRSAKYRTEHGLKLNIGCGPNRKAGWVNIDLFAPEADLSLDMREPLPFGSGSTTIIYSEHFFEHIGYPQPAKQFLAECHRILAGGGVFSVGVPDTEWALRAYVGPDDRNYFGWARKTWHPSWCRTRIESINHHFRQDGEHRFAYDYETLHQALAEAGFSDIRQRDFDPQLDAANREVGTLYVVAVK